MRRLGARGLTLSLATIAPAIATALALASGGCELLIHRVTQAPDDAGADATIDGPAGEAGAVTASDGGADATGTGSGDGSGDDAANDGSTRPMDGSNDAADAALTPCGALLPDGATRAGPSMVEIDSRLGSFCIDTTEVTVAQFNQYVLATGGALVDTPSGCEAGATTILADEHPADQDLPVTATEECYAWSYCRWAHKRLCGIIGDGGKVENAQPQDTEWTYVCLNGVANTLYPYGEEYDAGVCNTEAGAPVPVGSMPGCHGMMPPFDQVFDMSGNAVEYVNDIGDDTFGNVRPLGGGWAEGPNANCDYDVNGGGYAGYGYVGESGFRCCADPTP